MSVKNFFRNLLGIRAPRQILPLGDKPQVGSSLVLKSLRIQLDQPITQEFWDWLSQMGWRTIDVPNDRRRYSMLTDELLQQLMTTDMEKRIALHEYLMRVTVVREHRLKHVNLSFMQQADDRPA